MAHAVFAWARLFRLVSFVPIVVALESPMDMCNSCPSHFDILLWSCIRLCCVPCWLREGPVDSGGVTCPPLAALEFAHGHVVPRPLPPWRGRLFRWVSLAPVLHTMSFTTIGAFLCIGLGFHDHRPFHILRLLVHVSQVRNFVLSCIRAFSNCPQSVFPAALKLAHVQ